MSRSSSLITRAPRDRNPNSGEQEPEHVPDHGRGTCARSPDHRPAERPQDVGGEAERGDAEGDRDDEDAHDHSGERVSQRKPEARQDEPDQVENRAHRVSLTLSEPTRLGVPAWWSAANLGGVGSGECWVRLGGPTSRICDWGLPSLAKCDV